MFEPPLVVNPDPDAEMAEMLRAEFPVFVRVISCAVEVPTCTFPKVRLELLAATTAPAVGGVVLPPDDVADAVPADCRVDPQPIVPNVAIKAIARMSLRAIESRGSHGVLKPLRTAVSRWDNMR
jgi:hypothetical protein